MSNSNKNDNIFSKIINREIDATIIVENEYAICIEDLHPQAKLHYLVVPKQCYLDIIAFHSSASSDMMEGFWKLVDTIAPANGKFVANFGDYAHIPYFHMHLMSDDT